MSPACGIVSVESVILAVTEKEVPRGQVPAHMRAMFDVVYLWLRTAPVKQSGHNYALYNIGSAGNLLVRVGFPVSAPFADAESVRCLTLAEGKAAHATHVGPYNNLHRTYAALHSWCKQEGLQLTSQSWEVYGDWQEDELKLETGIYLRLRSCPNPSFQATPIS